MWYVYSVKMRNGHIYTGQTRDLKRRLAEHAAGQCQTTKSNLPVKLITYTAVETEQLAICFENYLKSGSGREFLRKRLLTKENPSA